MKYLTEAELCERWRVSKRRLYELRENGDLGYFRPTPRRVVYPLAEVERYERANTERSVYQVVGGGAA